MFKYLVAWQITLWAVALVLPLPHLLVWLPAYIVLATVAYIAVVAGVGAMMIYAMSQTQKAVFLDGIRQRKEKTNVFRR